jgi:hypothetical protein
LTWQLGGAAGFGAVIGWYLYFVNRYRKGDVQIGDITTVIGAIGGGAVLALFSKDSDLFGAYGVGLAIGFFGYFVSLMILVGRSKSFTSDWFLDGRRPNPPEGWGYGADAQQPVRTMDLRPEGAFPGPAHGTQNFFFNGAPAPAVASASQPLLSLPNPNAQKIVDACKTAWLGRHDACNFFAIAVAKSVGVTLAGTADSIVDQIKGVGWTRLANGPAARDAATQGKLVVAALKSGDFTQPRAEGHVAVVTPGPLNPLGWAPSGYWGSTDPEVAEKGGAGSPISLCFRLEDKDRIVYAAHDI